MLSYVNYIKMPDYSIFVIFSRFIEYYRRWPAVPGEQSVLWQLNRSEEERRTEPVWQALHDFRVILCTAELRHSQGKRDSLEELDRYNQIRGNLLASCDTQGGMAKSHESTFFLKKHQKISKKFEIPCHPWSMDSCKVNGHRWKSRFPQIK